MTRATQIDELPGPRSLQNAKAWMHDRLSKRVHPPGLTDPDATLKTIDSLKGLDGESRAAAWISAGDRFFRAGIESEKSGDLNAARSSYYPAYGFYFLGRFPCPNHPPKQASYHKELDAYERFGALAEPPVISVALSFNAPQALSSQTVYLEGFRALSLLEQGLLSKLSAPAGERQGR